jgi:hypothetical protein
VTGELDLTASENQRLRSEVKELRARVAAFESSRWWRAHPRFVLAHLRARETAAGEEISQPEPRPAPGPADDLAARFEDEVVARGTFSEDWFTVHIPAWEAALSELEDRPPSVLELGSFEGLSACFLLWRLPQASLTCVDTFEGIPAYAAYGIASRLEGTFDRNIALVDASRVRKLVGKSHHVLPKLVDEGAQFDLVYVDASHRALDVAVDAALSWDLLAVGGIAIFDDYGPVPPEEDPLQHPTPAIDAFLGLVSGRYDVIDDGRQLIVRKTG